MSIFGLLVLIADVYAIVQLFKGKGPQSPKIVWSIIILLLPLLGVILWWFFGPGKKR